MTQQLVTELLASDRDLSEVVRAYATIVSADARAQREAQQRAAQEAHEEACRTLERWIEQYLPGFFTRVDPVHFVRGKSDLDRVGYLVVRIDSRQIDLVCGQDSAGGPSIRVVDPHQPNQPEMRIALTDDTASNWALLIPVLAKLTGALARAEEA